MITYSPLRFIFLWALYSFHQNDECLLAFRQERCGGGRELDVVGDMQVDFQDVERQTEKRPSKIAVGELNMANE